MRKLILPVFAACALGALAGCSVNDGPVLLPAPDRGWDTGVETGDDSDGDGVDDESDCAPDDAFIFPGADEICNDGEDNDCDALIDGDDPACGG